MNIIYFKIYLIVKVGFVKSSLSHRLDTLDKSGFGLEGSPHNPAYHIFVG